MAVTNQQKINWHLDVLPRATQMALTYLSRQNWLRRSKWYLAGGTSLALRSGHRQSVDLDFFTPKSNFSESILLKHFPKSKWQTDVLREKTIYGRLLDAKVSFIAYPFFIPHKSFDWYGNVRILSIRDLAVMKIIAISQRGRKRDFIDLYWHCLHNESLSTVLQRLPSQYPNIAHNYHHIIKSLTYFNDAENEPMPKIFFKANWAGIKKFFQKEAANAARELLGLK